jgi:hypothetical protein
MATAERSLRFMGLVVERIGGQRSGTHKIENKSAFVAVAVGVSPDGRIVAENGDAVREWVEVNVGKTWAGLKVFDASFNVGNFDGDFASRGNGIGDCGQDCD